MRDTGNTRLGRTIAPLAARNGARPADQAAYLEPGTPVKAGLYALAGGREALAARVVLADAAERSLDIQYYIWRNDRSGTFMFNAVLRGRRSRRAGAAAPRRQQHDRARIRSCGRSTGTPISRCGCSIRSRSVRLRMFGFLTDFKRLNRRMHNKSFTADNQATIIGGRNIGDEYFDATDERAFADLDVLAVGAIVDQVSTDFDRYWASESAFPAGPPAAAGAGGHHEGPAGGCCERRCRRPRATVATPMRYRSARFLRELFEAKLELEWAVTRMVSDDPAQGRSARCRPPLRWRSGWSG